MRAGNVLAWLTLFLVPACADETSDPAKETHGNKQVRSMIADMPAMARLVSPGDAVWIWTARRFEGEGRSSRVYWEPTLRNLVVGRRVQLGELEYGGSANDYRQRLRTRQDDPQYDSELLWVSAVNELLNAEDRAAQREHLVEQALKGRLSRSDWLVSNLRIEFRALKRVQYFYETVWKGHAASRGFELSPGTWSPPSIFEESVNETLILGTDAGKRWFVYYNEEVWTKLKLRDIPVPR